jgi:hypothetical protein
MPPFSYIIIFFPMNAASSSRLQDQDNPIKDGKAEIMAGMDVVQLNVVNPRYNIIGAEMQVVNIELKPGDSVEVSPGAMMHHGVSFFFVDLSLYSERSELHESNCIYGIFSQTYTRRQIVPALAGDTVPASRMYASNLRIREV